MHGESGGEDQTMANHQDEEAEDEDWRDDWDENEPDESIHPKPTDGKTLLLTHIMNCRE